MKTKKFLKTLISISLCACLCAGTVLGATGCSTESSSSQSGSNVENSLVTLNSYARTVEEGESFTLIATVESGSVVWTSSDTSVATVDANGKVTALKKGSATITATCGEEYASCLLTVNEKVMLAPTFDLGIKTTALYVEGKPVQLNPYVTVDGKALTAEEKEALNIVYESNDAGVATVSATGLVTAVGFGNATVKASFTYNGVYFEDSVTVTVQDLIFFEPTVESLTLASSKTLAGNDNANGSTSVVGAKVFRGKDLVEVPDVTIVYESTDDSVVTVDENGNVTAVAEGSASIKMTYSGLTVETAVTVATALASKADLDKLATAYKDGNLALWGEEAYYVLANDIDYKGEYIMPIAAMPAEFIGLTFGGTEASQKWGVFGKLNSATDANFSYGFGFAGTIDGNGCTITNAVIPFGTTVYTILGGSGNFIGYLSGTLKNIAFKGVTTETGEEYWAKYGPNGTHVNEYQETYYNYSSAPDWSGVNQLAGIVGMSMGTIDNVFVDITMSIAGTGSGGAGALLAYNHPNGGKVSNCVTKVALDGFGVDYWVSGNKMDAGLIVGQGDSGSLVKNSFVIVNEDVKPTNIWYGLDVPHINVERYESVGALLSAQQRQMAEYGYGEFWTNWLA